MSTNLRHVALGVGIHASLDDFFTVPSFSPVLSRGPVLSLAPRPRGRNERPLTSPDGRVFPGSRGAKDIGAITLPLEVRGVDDNSGGAVSDWEAKLELGRILQSFFVGAAPATTGAATTASGTAGATLTVAAGTGIPNGSVIRFQTTTGSFVRQVVSGGGTTTLTLDRAASGTASGAVTRLARYTQNESETHPLHLAVSAEHTDPRGIAARRVYLGCMPQTLTLGIPDAGPLTADVTLMPSTWQTASPLSPSFTAPPGAPVVNANKDFRIGSRQLDVMGLQLNVDLGAEMRSTFLGPDGVRGGIISSRSGVTLTGSFLPGGLSGLELADSTGTPSLQELLGTADDLGRIAGVHDVMLQLDGGPGFIFYARMRAAELQMSPAETGDFLTYSFTAHATGPGALVLALG